MDIVDNRARGPGRPDGRDHRRASGQPRGNRVVGRPRPIGGKFEQALLVVEADRRLFERCELGGDKVPALIFFAGDAEAVGFLVESGVTQGEEILFDHLIVIHHRAEAFVVVGPQFDRGRGAVLGALGGGDKRAGGVAEAEEDGVGAAGERERLGVIAILWHVVAEQILADDRGRAAAGHILRRDVDEVVAAVVGAAHDKGVGVGREGEDIVDVRGPEVVQHLLGKDGQGGTDVAQVSFQAGSAERLGGEVSLFTAGIDLERGEHGR